jgi:hypothetical protein
MSAMFAFEVGDVSMKSLTFESVMKDVSEALSDPEDKEVLSDALVLNCLWVDEISPGRKRYILTVLCRVLDMHLESGEHADNEVALLQIDEVRKELRRRYPDLVSGEHPQ